MRYLHRFGRRALPEKNISFWEEKNPRLCWKSRYAYPQTAERISIPGLLTASQPLDPLDAASSLNSQSSNMSISYAMGCTKKAWALGFIFPTTRVFRGRPSIWVALPLRIVSPAYVMHNQSTDVADSLNSVGTDKTSQSK